MADFDARLIDQYQDEMNYLRQSGREFAKKYPKIAARLELSGQESPDPQVERLLESFAFLTARIQARIDDQNAVIPAAILQQLHPYMVDPIPPITTGYFNASVNQKIAPGGRIVPRGSPFYLQTGQGEYCRFLTSYDVDLRPLEITHADIQPVTAYKYFDTSEVASVLRLEISGQGLPISEIPIDKLRIHLAGDTRGALDLHEILLSNVVSAALLGDDALKPTYFSGSIVSEVGYAEDEAVLLDRQESLPAYRLLAEYFCCPEKFLYIDLNELGKRPNCSKLTVLLGLNTQLKRNLKVDANQFRLGCTPMVNLFPKTLEPIRLDHTKEQYFLEPEVSGLLNYEIHSINRVTVSSPALSTMRVLESYFGYKHTVGDTMPTEFWFTKRTGAGSNLTGSQMHMSFVDLNFTTQRPAGETVTVQSLCTNRNLAEQIPTGAVLQGDEDFGAPLIVLRRPSPTVYSPVDGATLWLLVSQLNLHHFSFSGDKNSIDALREILKLYCPDYRPTSFQEVMGLKKMKVDQVVRRVGNDTWRGFARGNKIKLLVDERNFVGGNPYLLGSVLSRFFGLYSTVNSFTELEIETVQREGIWKKWMPVTGEQALM